GDVHRSIWLLVHTRADQLRKAIEGHAALVPQADRVAFGNAASLGIGNLNVEGADSLGELIHLVGDAGNLVVDVAAQIGGAGGKPRDVVGQRLALQHGEVAD